FLLSSVRCLGPPSKPKHLHVNRKQSLSSGYTVVTSARRAFVQTGLLNVLPQQGRASRRTAHNHSLHFRALGTLVGASRCQSLEDLSPALQVQQWEDHCRCSSGRIIAGAAVGGSLQVQQWEDHYRESRQRGLAMGWRWHFIERWDYLPASDADPEDVDERKGTTTESDNPRKRVTLCLKTLVLLVVIALLSVDICERIAPRRDSQTGCETLAVRHEWRALNATERNDFVQSVICLSTIPSRWRHNGTLYDDFAQLHGTIGRYSHHSASFLPWHRWTLHVWEKALKEHCGFRGHVPYWDWTRDWMDIASSSIWDPNTGFGGNGNPNGEPTVGHGTCVEDGPFTGLRPIKYNHTYQTHCLSRGFADKATLDRLLGENFSPESIGRIMRAEEYTKFKWAIEFRLHNNIHTAIRGDFWAMTAANDPLFFLHHAQLDRLWWQWQQQKPEARLEAYEGRHMANSTDDSANPQDTLLFDGFVEDVPVSYAMNAGGKELCYKYY
ncbi:tyrosinase, partial [Teratosphaeria destructans]